MMRGMTKKKHVSPEALDASLVTSLPTMLDRLPIFLQTRKYDGCPIQESYGASC